MFKKATQILLVLAMVMLLAACGSSGTFSGGSGTEQDPYQIRTAEDLWTMAKLINSEDTQKDYMSACYVLTADIDLGGKKEWMPIGYYSQNTDSFTFEGVFDGKNHAISGIRIDYKDPLVGTRRNAFGLFGELHGTVKNLTIRNSTIQVDGEASVSVGAVAGNLRKGAIENCHTTDSVRITGTYKVGGICGNASTEETIRGCTNGADVTATSHVGMAAGIAAHSGCAIVECTNSGDITSTGDAAGICGNANQGISDCTNSGRIQAWSYAAGIICNFDDGALNKDMNDASIILARCVNTGDVTSVGVTKGDVVIGHPAAGIAVSCRTGNVVDCVNSGNVTAGAEAGGILAYFQKSSFGTACEVFLVSGCSNSGKIMSTETGASVGGICGILYSDGTEVIVENCKNSGTIEGVGMEDVAMGSSDAGGIVGKCVMEKVSLVECSNSGSVTGWDSAGGILGTATPNRDLDGVLRVENCVNSGQIHTVFSGGLTQEIFVGGIVGFCRTDAGDDAVSSAILVLEMEGCENTGILSGDSELVALYTDDLCASNKLP